MKKAGKGRPTTVVWCARASAFVFASASVRSTDLKRRPAVAPGVDEPERLAKEAQSPPEQLPEH